MRLRGFGLLLAVVGLSLSGQGCDSGSVDLAGDTGGVGGGTATGKGVGEACSGVDLCRHGLACVNGKCELGHSTAEGGPCLLGGECVDGLQCSAGQCQPGGSGDAGAACSSDLDCKSGLRCVLAGFSTQCAPEGSGDVGAACKTAGDCYAGLTCLAGKCNPPPPGAPTFGVPSWPGVACDAASSATVRAYFEIPGATNPKGQEGDFFRLPFPNDVRIKNGKLDLGGFPTPGSDLLGFDPVQIYVDALSKESHFGTYATVIFRFSGELGFDSFKQQNNGAVHWEDVTAGTPEYGSSAGAYFNYEPNDSHYVCKDSVSIRRPQGQPMVPGHVYAVYLTTVGTDKNGKPIERSEHLVSMLGNTAPTDPVLAAAYPAFKPFRDYLKDKLIDPSTILNATVITAGPVRDPMKQLAQAVTAAPAPTAKGWVKCGGGAKSPCPQADGDRACGDGSSPDYDEYQALVTLPIFQQGTPPYFDAGGDVRTDQPERSEDVCMALTVPKGATMPATGWPLVIYAHGTGGSFRSHVSASIAGALAKASSSAGSVGFAVLGIDQVEHGPRRGSSTASPNDLFYNFKNPLAARGNPLQGGADQLSLARFASSLDIDAATSGGDAIKIDPASIVFYGHSQGSTEGSLALPYSDVFKAAVLSGNGASIIDALQSKTQPVNIAGALPFVLEDIYPADGKLWGGDFHPVLSLLQTYIDPADPLNHASAIGRAPETGHVPKHVFQTYGLGDHYSPGRTMATFALAGGFDLASPDSSVTTPEPIAGLSPLPVPLAGNADVAGTPITLAVREYAPASGGEGHFVATEVATATADLTRFLAMAVEGAVPAVGK